jgi:hypothetical protein
MRRRRQETWTVPGFLPRLNLPLQFHDIQTRLGIFVEYRVGATARVFDLEFRIIQDGSPLFCCTCATRIA